MAEGRPEIWSDNHRKAGTNQPIPTCKHAAQLCLEKFLSQLYFPSHRLIGFIATQEPIVKLRKERRRVYHNITGRF